MYCFSTLACINVDVCHFSCIAAAHTTAWQSGLLLTTKECVFLWRWNVREKICFFWVSASDGDKGSIKPAIPFAWWLGIYCAHAAPYNASLCADIARQCINRVVGSWRLLAWPPRHTKYHSQNTQERCRRRVVCALSVLMPNWIYCFFVRLGALSLFASTTFFPFAQLVNLRDFLTDSTRNATCTHRSCIASDTLVKHKMISQIHNILQLFNSVLLFTFFYKIGSKKFTNETLRW